MNAYALDVISADSFPQSVEQSSLVLCCADKKEVRQFVNAIARQYAKPCVTASVFRQGFGGEVYAYLPGETGCFACMDRAAAEQGININDAIQLLPEEEQHMYGLNLQDYRSTDRSLENLLGFPAARPHSDALKGGVTMTENRFCVSPHGSTDFYGRYWQGQMPPHAIQAINALYAKPANALFAWLWRKSLILAVGT